MAHQEKEAPKSEIIKIAAQSDEQIFSALKTSRTGITESEARVRRERYGKNILKTEQAFRPIAFFIAQFRSPLVLLLVVAAIASGFLASWLSAGAILIIVAVSAIINFTN